MGNRSGRILEEDVDTEAIATRVLGGVLVLAVLTVVVFAVAPIGQGDTYTEFYVLGPDGSASEYPENTSVGETAIIRVGIGNFEAQKLTYTLIIRRNQTTFVTRKVTLDPQEQWEEPVDVTFESVGSKRLQLELYLGETTRGEPYRSLRLFVKVTSE